MGEVHCWSVNLDVPAATQARFYASLATDERDRSARFRFEQDRRRFVVARGALREVLGRNLGVPPDQIRFAYSTFGKPALSAEFGSRLKFNLSHSGDLALIVVADGADVGVDVEQLREGDYSELAQEMGLPTDAFFEGWTKREAYVKARGDGLPDGPVEFSGDWSFFELNPAPGYVGAVVLLGAHPPEPFRPVQLGP